MRLLLPLAAVLFIASCEKSTPSWNAPQSQSPSATPSGNAVLLQWNPVVLPNLSGYRVYYGTASRAYLQPLGQGLTTATNSFTVTGLTRTTRYFFAVTATDSLGNESGYSDEVSTNIP